LSDRARSSGGIINTALVIHGKIEERRFVSDEPMPDVEGPAELIVYSKEVPQKEKECTSIFDLFGRAEHLRSAKDIDSQIHEVRYIGGRTEGSDLK
jgi:hypothetical protein